jgi:hypothetical protein
MVNVVQILCAHACEWKKMIPVETIPGMGEREIKENGGGGELKYCSFFYPPLLVKCLFLYPNLLFLQGQ